MSRPQQKSVWYLQIFVMTEGRTRTYHQEVHTFVCCPKVIQIEAPMKICTVKIMNTLCLQMTLIMLIELRKEKKN